MALSSDLIQIGLTPKQADFLGDTVEISIVAAGANQANAYQLTKTLNALGTVALNADGVKLPTPINTKAGRVVVHNGTTGRTAQVYPDSGAAIDELGANNPYALAVNTTREFIRFSSTIWISK